MGAAAQCVIQPWPEPRCRGGSAINRRGSTRGDIVVHHRVIVPALMGSRFPMVAQRPRW